MRHLDAYRKIADEFAETTDPEAQSWRGANAEKAQRVAVVLRANQPLRMAGRVLQAIFAAMDHE